VVRDVGAAHSRQEGKRAMKEKFSAAVEEVMGRRVIAFLSQVHFNPDISQETFVLEPEPDDRSPQAPAQ
jgi:uncharacterized protein YbcI